MIEILNYNKKEQILYLNLEIITVVSSILTVTCNNLHE